MGIGPRERHRIGRIGWLRAAVLGANDGILSTASLMLGVATAHATHANILVAGVAGLVAGAMSMAAGEYVSVHSQADTEKAELELERTELKSDNAAEHRELAAIYITRGLQPALAKQVAQQRRTSGKGGRRRCDGWRHPGRVLGRAGDGGDGGRRRPVRISGVVDRHTASTCFCPTDPGLPRDQTKEHFHE
jgi:hypothetical protein